MILVTLCTFGQKSNEKLMGKLGKIISFSWEISWKIIKKNPAFLYNLEGVSSDFSDFDQKFKGI